MKNKIHSELQKAEFGLPEILPQADFNSHIYTAERGCEPREDWIDGDCLDCAKCDRFVSSVNRKGLCPECEAEERFWEADAPALYASR